MSDGEKQLSGTKHDIGKPRTDLLSAPALLEVSRVLSHSAATYGINNWRRGIAWSRLIGAALRHLFAFMTGHDIDDESGLPHIAHAMCCVMFLTEYYVTGTGLDDRWKVG